MGWVVRAAGKMDTLLIRLAAGHTAFPPIQEVYNDPRHKWNEKHLPPDLCKFYYRTNGAELFGRGDAAAYRIAAAEDITPLDWGEIPQKSPSDRSSTNGPTGRENVVVPQKSQSDRWTVGGIWHRFASSVFSYFNPPLPVVPPDPPDPSDGHIWHRFAWLADQSWLAINLTNKWGRCVICCCNANTQGQPGKNPVVALSFTELLERMLGSGGRLYWLDPQFVGYGDAESYTRR